MDGGKTEEVQKNSNETSQKVPTNEKSSETTFRYEIDEMVTPSGQKTRTTRTYKIDNAVRRVTKNSIERKKNWILFGEAENDYEHTSVGDKVEFVFEKSDEKKNLQEIELRKKVMENINLIRNKNTLVNKSNTIADNLSSYRPYSQTGNRNDFTLKISGISEMATESELRHVLKKYGRLNRLNIPIDPLTGRNKGLAFASYESESEAEKAMKNLKDYGKDHLIWYIERIMPRPLS